MGPDREHLQAGSPQHCCPSLGQLLPGTAHPAPASSWAFISVLPALPTISISMGTFWKPTAMPPLGSPSPPLPCALYPKPSWCLSLVTGDFPSNPIEAEGNSAVWKGAEGAGVWGHVQDMETSLFMMAGCCMTCGQEDGMKGGGSWEQGISRVLLARSFTMLSTGTVSRGTSYHSLPG